MDIPAAAGRSFNTAINAPLVTNAQINHFRGFPDSVAPPTPMELIEGLAMEVSLVGPASRAREHFQAVESLSAIGDRAGAISHAQGFMFESGGIALAATGLGATARATAGEMSVARTANALRLHNTSPDVFANLFPEDIPRPANIIPNGRLMTMNQRRLGYVVLDDGRLVVGKNGRASGQGHVDLAQGQTVLAAGEFRVLNGDLVYIDNWSGHYRSSGASAQFQAENAFQRLGFDVKGKYTERRFD